MLKILKVLLYLAVFTGIGIVAYALFFDLPAPQSEVTQSITPNLD